MKLLEVGVKYCILGGGFKYLFFSPQFDQYFSNGLNRNHQLVYMLYNLPAIFFYLQGNDYVAIRQ